jgi:hypothetical protein
METGLCPSPEHPIIAPDQKGMVLRKKLHLIYYGQIGVVLARFLIFGGVAGFFQLVNLWIVYTAYATLHFCSCFLFFLMCLLELLFIMADWRRAT